MGAVDATVRGVFFTASAGGAVPAVLLGLPSGKALPIYIGLWEAISINNALNDDLLPRPGTHDLFVAMLESYGIRVTGLTIDDLRDGVFYARLVSVREEGEESLDCRPSDGIAIAIRSGAPIAIEEVVAEKAGVEEEDLPSFVDLSTYLS
ncbi:bifunctional nuclease family protein [Methanofollis aquaemaris]|uniref:Bifunctional nuclease family protein n=1 Tax=Methanofollis aquaemaris TaxID=126734 RepID=A0A8A3S848_9EURY|nr:bifunctional nuclease family protein [Methanofollis aquaemaris]QSZ67766.1 bifunctional nuclease family protein [Methanofollis aquaemaris]